mgnify:CR=1 FL=1
MATGRKGKKGNNLQNVWTINTLQRELAKAKNNLEVAIAEKVQQKYITTFEMEVEQLEREINEHSTKRS